MTLVLRSGANPGALAAPARAAIRQMDPSLPVADVRSMDEVLGSALSTPTFMGILLSMLAALSLALIGIAGGLALAFAVTRLLHGVAPADPATFAVVAVALVGVAAAASLVPAWRASRVDPVVALKSD